MKLIAIHEIVRKPKAVQPGESFEVTDKECAELLALGAAKVDAETVAEEPVKPGRKKKDHDSEESMI